MNRARTLAILWQRFGPYHRARLRGASQAFEAAGWQVRGVEVASRDQYRWETEFAHERVTLFPDQEYEKLSSAAIKRAMTRGLDDMNPCAVAINGWSVPEALAALRWCRRHRRRSVLMSESHEPSSNWLKEWVKRWRVSRFDAALVGGSWHAEYLRKLGFPAARIELGYDVVDNEHFARASADSSVVDSWPTPYFFANTRFLERKGIDALLRAFALYRQAVVKDAGWNLIISGSGPMESAWKELAHELGIAAFVHWPGFLQYDVLPAAYQRAGAFVHPARSEPWGLVVNEAAAAGLPLIVGRRAGAACELVHEGENGVLIDPDDMPSFAEALGRMAGLSEEERREMGSASRRIVAEFGPDRFGQALLRCVQTRV